MQLRKALHQAESHAEHFRTQATSAHAKQQRMLEARRTHRFGHLADAPKVVHLPLGDVQPAKRIGNDFLMRRVLVPKAEIPRPEPAHETRLPHFL